MAAAGDAPAVDGGRHVVTAEPVYKLGYKGGTEPLAFTFACSCGRKGKGWHRTEEKAITAGGEHIPPAAASDEGSDRG